MIANVPSTELALISTAGHLVRMLVVRTLNVRLGTTEPFALVPLDMLETH